MQGLAARRRRGQRAKERKKQPSRGAEEERRVRKRSSWDRLTAGTFRPGLIPSGKRAGPAGSYARILSRHGGASTCSVAGRFLASGRQSRRRERMPGGNRCRDGRGVNRSAGHSVFPERGHVRERASRLRASTRGRCRGRRAPRTRRRNVHRRRRRRRRSPVRCGGSTAPC